MSARVGSLIIVDAVTCLFTIILIVGGRKFKKLLDTIGHFWQAMPMKLITTRQAGTQLGLNRKTIIRMIKRGVLVGTNINPDGQPVWRISQNEVDRLLGEN